MKKIISCLLVLAMVLGCIPAFGAEGRVEIIFKVGDSTLLINGSEVTVEKPYVVGEGVTLVPIRVITEAFGAQVDWVAETKTVKLSYPDVEIVIQIDNPTAEVNGKAETLLAPPELTASGFTMIPLRFISENFGAEVSYDAATGGIAVIKEMSGGDIVSAGISSKYIGDSFYGWSMENPVDMTMDDRSFDGRGTLFVEGDNEITVKVYAYDAEEYDFEKDYNDIKMSFSDYTLVKAEKNTDDEKCKVMHFAMKNKTDYLDYQHYVTPENIFVVTGLFPNEDAAARDEYLEILSTFKCSYGEGDIHDLSNNKDGFRRFESEKLKLSFDVPDNYFMDASEETQNRFNFKEIKNKISDITLVVYSKSDVGSAKELAQEDYNHNKTAMNEELAKFSSGITDKKYVGISAVEYSYTIESYSFKNYTRDVFFEIGDYVYNMSVSVELPCDDRDGYIDRIVNSIKAEPLDAGEVGVFMKNVPVATGTFDVKMGSGTIKLPNVYTKATSSSDLITYTSPLNGMVLFFWKEPGANISLDDLKKSVERSEETMKETSGGEVVNETHMVTVNGKRGYGYVMYTTDEDEAAYGGQYIFLHDGTVYGITFSCPDYCYSKSTKTEIQEIMDSLTFE